jgi:hypothetical protein
MHDQSYKTNPMKWLDKLDDEFVSLAGDDEARGMKLARLRNRRVFCLGFGLLFIVAAVALSVTGPDKGWGFAMVGVGWVCIGFKYEADIRTLKVIEHFQKRT